MYVYMYVYIYIYICICVYIYIYIHIHTHLRRAGHGREAQPGAKLQDAGAAGDLFSTIAISFTKNINTSFTNIFISSISNTYIYIYIYE